MTPDKPFFVLTGGPGAGKTTVIDALREAGQSTTTEAGRAVIAAAFAAGNDPPWLDPVAYAGQMLDWDLAEYEQADPRGGPTFFDRGIPDILGYLTLVGRQPPPRLLEAVEQHRYNSTVFYFPAWREIYRQDSERHQDFPEAERTAQLMVSAYERLGYSLVTVPTGSVADRVAFILSQRNVRAA